MSTQSFEGIRSLINEIKTNWKDILIEILDKNKEMEKNINLLLEKDYSRGKVIYPPQKDIFNAFNYFNVKEMKCLILGQDVYHSEGQAHGLSFSVKEGCKAPPSLKNIFKELKREFGIEREKTDLTDWAKQGVLMLNTALTVIEHQPESHIFLWQPFTEEILGYIGKRCKGFVGMLWGNHAKGYRETLLPKEGYRETLLPKEGNRETLLPKEGNRETLLPKEGNRETDNFILEWTHPSPLSRKPFDCNHFIRCNEILKKEGKGEIKWV